MKLRNSLIFLSIALLISGCGTKASSSGNDNVEPTPVDPADPSEPVDPPSPPDPPAPPSGPTKHTVDAHTLSDSNPPINVNSKGQQVSEDTWNSFRYGGTSKYSGHYNYTYVSNSGTEKFTKNGYYVESVSGKLYYERKSGSTFYIYMSTSEGWLREETTLDLQSKYTYRINQEVYVHMFDYSDYTFNSSDGKYRYSSSAFSSIIMFQGGYLTYLYYSVSGYTFEIKLSFQTTISIPKSYYYE